MKPNESIKLFEEKKVRTLWDEEQEKWYISVVDVSRSHRSTWECI
ncbi:hypothetical protein [Sulfurimonas sp.]|nr:hypothetical protein [Sulfurimonas sp.]